MHALHVAHGRVLLLAGRRRDLLRRDQPLERLSRLPHGRLAHLPAWNATCMHTARPHACRCRPYVLVSHTLEWTGVR